MNSSSPFSSTGGARRLVVTVVIGTAAALTAGVVLSEHPPGESVAGHAAAGTAVANSLAPPPGEARRVQWRDPWKHPASDPSVPAAAKALEGRPDLPIGERAPTF